MLPKSALGTPTLGTDLRPETFLAGLPRLVRVADEARWRGQAAVATSLVVVAFWLLSWWAGEPVDAGLTILAAVAVGVPTLLTCALTGGRRLREGLVHAVPPPRSTVHETAASSRDRRLRFAGIVLTGIVALLLFDRFTDGSGMTAGLLAGLLGSLGAVDWWEARQWELAERERGTRIFVVVRPDALSPRILPSEVYETPRPGGSRDRDHEASPFDLGV
jgi:hypothetical protein